MATNINGRYGYHHINTINRKEKTKELKDDDAPKKQNRDQSNTSEKKEIETATEEKDIKNLDDAFYPPVQIRIEKLYS